MQDAGYGDWALLDPMMAASRQGQMGGEGSVAATTGWNPANPASATGVAGAGCRARREPQARRKRNPPPTNPYDMNQAYLDRALESGPR